MSESDEYLDSSWSNGPWLIFWYNKDELFIEGPNNQECIMDGGDFESILSGLCAAYKKGKP